MIKYGDKVTITKQYFRRSKCPNIKFWDNKIVLKHGIFLGYRILRNGTVVDQGDSFGLNIKTTFKAALVSPGENLKPIYVPIDHMDKDLK